jgi:hypothetical protein
VAEMNITMVAGYGLIVVSGICADLLGAIVVARFRAVLVLECTKCAEFIIKQNGFFVLFKESLFLPVILVDKFHGNLVKALKAPCFYLAGIFITYYGIFFLFSSVLQFAFPSLLE